MTSALRVNVVVAFFLAILSASFIGWYISGYYATKIITALRQRCGLQHPPGWARSFMVKYPALVLALDLWMLFALAGIFYAPAVLVWFLLATQ